MQTDLRCSRAMGTTLVPDHIHADASLFQLGLLRGRSHVRIQMSTSARHVLGFYCAKQGMTRGTVGNAAVAGACHNIPRKRSDPLA